MLKNARYLLFLLLVALVSCHTTNQTTGSKILVNKDANGLALQGYDPVAFFTEQQPVLGNPEITADYQEATYYFASQKNRDLFNANPDKYAPQYGGFCTIAVSQGKLSPVDIQTWSIVDGRLYFQEHMMGAKKFKAAPEPIIRKASEQWPGLVEKYGNASKATAAKKP